MGTKGPGVVPPCAPCVLDLGAEVLEIGLGVGVEPVDELERLEGQWVGHGAHEGGAVHPGGTHAEAPGKEHALGSQLDEAELVRLDEGRGVPVRHGEGRPQRVALVLVFHRKLCARAGGDKSSGPIQKGQTSAAMKDVGGPSCLQRSLFIACRVVPCCPCALTTRPMMVTRASAAGGCPPPLMEGMRAKRDARPSSATLAVWMAWSESSITGQPLLSRR